MNAYLQKSELAETFSSWMSFSSEDLYSNEFLHIIIMKLYIYHVIEIIFILLH